MRLRLSSTSTRTFVVLPAVVLAEQALARRRLRPRWLPLLLWGYLQYRLAGDYRITRAGGPPGLSQGYPERIITTGIYARTRNPMYLGVITVVLGEAVLFGSSRLLAYAGAVFVAFNAFVLLYEEPAHRRRFGADFEEYCRRVPRWVPRPW